MKIKFLGASGMVTGSCYLLTADSGNSIVIDCGMFQGRKEISDLNLKEIDIDPMTVSGVILSHAHLDHCGRLPLFVKKGYTKNIYMTPPTLDLTELTLNDTAKIAHENGKTLFNEDDVATTLTRFKTVEYEKQFEVDEFKITLSDAGHILGSAFIEIEVDGKKIVFSADLGNSPQDLIKPTDTVKSADIVVLESTYGNRVHKKEDASEFLKKHINEIEKDGGTILIPAFSIERSQEILHKIGHLKAKNMIKKETQIFFDGPMGQKATLIFERYRQYFNSEIENDYKNLNPFEFEGLTIVRNADQSQAISKISGPKIIMAGSGMMMGGRIINHAAEFLPNPTTRLLFVGYQAEGTAGRQIFEGAKQVFINGKKVSINAKIDDLESLSSHADMPALISWLGKINGVKKVFLTHGEDDPRRFLAQKITKDLGITDITLPKLGEEIKI